MILHVAYPTRASYYSDWLEAFNSHSRINVTEVNLFRNDAGELLKENLNNVDIILLLHSCTADSLIYIDSVAPLLQSRNCKLIMFVGNELNMPHIKLSDRIELARKLGADIILTQLLQEAGDWLYKYTGAEVLSLPHALNEKKYYPTTPHHKRNIMFGVRSYRYPTYLGDNDRNRIVEFVKSLNCANDISFIKRLDPEDWAKFLNRCKATPTTEAGGWYLERDDKIVQEIYDYATSGSNKIIINRGTFLTKIVNGLPMQFKQLIKNVLKYLPIADQANATDDLSFDLIYNQFFINRQKCPTYSKCISSRHFEAIGTRTIQISFPGRYNDILQANKHYFELDTDFKNIAEIMNKLEDKDYCEDFSQNALEFVLENHTYDKRISTLLTHLKVN